MSFSTDPREYSTENGEVSLCEFLLDTLEVVPIILANQDNKTMKKGEEAGNALALRSVQWVEYSEERSREQCQVKEKKRYFPGRKSWVFSRNVPITERS